MPLPTGYTLVEEKPSIPEGYELQTPDFGPSADNKEGLYQMKDKSGKEIGVPYSKIASAFDYGYRLHGPSITNYLKDAAADPELENISRQLGVKVSGRNQAGRPIIASEDPSLLRAAADLMFNADNLKHAASSSWQELKGTAQGFASTLQPPDSTVGRLAVGILGPAAMVPMVASRVAKGEAESRKKLTEQAAEQFEAASKSKDAGDKAGNVARGVASTVLSGLPIPGVASIATGINESADKGDISEMIGKGIVDVPLLAIQSEAVAEKIGDAASSVKEGLRGASQTAVGAGSRRIKQVVGEVAKKAKEEQDAHSVAIQDAHHENQGKELAYQQAVKAAEDTAADANKILEAEHLKATQDALQETREREAFHQNELKKAREDSEEAYQKKLKEVENERAEAKEEYKEQVGKYFEARDKIRADRDAAVEKYHSEIEKQRNVSPIQAKLEDASKELRGRVETARENAKRIGNQKYNGINPTLDPIDADQQVVHDAILQASEDLKGSKADPAILKSMLKMVERPDETFTYADLQGDYSALGSELVKGTLPGDVYHAYNVLHEAIGGEMQRIADSQGLGAQLTDARNYWRRMKETFGKPISLRDNATAAIKEANPDFLTDDAQANRVRLLGSFDDKIPGLVRHIGNIQEGVESLPNPESERVVLKKATEEATKKPLPTPPPKPEVIPDPDPIAPKQVAPPNRVEVPDKPPVVEPKPQKQVERTPYPDKPERRVVDPEKLRNDLIDKKMAQWTDVSRWQVARLLTGPLSALLGTILGNKLAEYGGVVYGMAELTPFALQKALDNPKVREWFTKPPVGEIDVLNKIPEADRLHIIGGLNQILAKAKASGQTIRVSPVVGKFLSEGHTQRVQDLKKEAEERNPRQKATTVQHEDASAEIPPELQRIRDGLNVRIVKGKPYQDAVASVSENEPHVIEVNNVERFNQGPKQTIAHELTHLLFNNLAGPIRAKIPKDDPEDKYGIHNVDAMRKSGLRLWNLPQEKAATIVQTWVANPHERARLQPWIDDFNDAPLSVEQPTAPGDKKINMAIRPPLPPATNGYGLQLPAMPLKALKEEAAKRAPKKSGVIVQ